MFCLKREIYLRETGKSRMDTNTSALKTVLEGQQHQPLTSEPSQSVILECYWFKESASRSRRDLTYRLLLQGSHNTEQTLSVIPLVFASVAAGMGIVPGVMLFQSSKKRLV